MYNTFFGECSSLKKRLWDFKIKYDKPIRINKDYGIKAIFFKLFTYTFTYKKWTYHMST